MKIWLCKQDGTRLRGEYVVNAVACADEVHYALRLVQTEAEKREVTLDPERTSMEEIGTSYHKLSGVISFETFDSSTRDRD